MVQPSRPSSRLARVVGWVSVAVLLLAGCAGPGGSGPAPRGVADDGAFILPPTEGVRVQVEVTNPDPDEARTFRIAVRPVDPDAPLPLAAEDSPRFLELAAGEVRRIAFEFPPDPARLPGTYRYAVAITSGAELADEVAFRVRIPDRPLLPSQVHAWRGELAGRLVRVRGVVVPLPTSRPVSGTVVLLVDPPEATDAAGEDASGEPKPLRVAGLAAPTPGETVDVRGRLRTMEGGPVLAVEYRYPASEARPEEVAP